jgi:MFS family permease
MIETPSNISPSDETKLKEKTMNVSIIEGSAANIALTFGDNYITPFMLSVNATNADIGLLSSISGILAPTTQIIGSRLMEKFSRKGLLCFGVLFQSLMWPLFILLGYLYLENIIQDEITYTLMGFYLMYVCFGAIVGPSWFSEMGDVVPEDRRGRYFAKRNIIFTIFAFVGTTAVPRL